jgi:nucleotide-binding universal stress UspA family protein
MVKILVPFDGSKPALRAVKHAIRRAKTETAEIHLLNVQPPVPIALKGAIDSTKLKRYHQEEGAKVLAAAEKTLARSRVAYRRHIVVGRPGEAVAEFAGESGADEIVMGVRGMGAVMNLLMGSTTTKVLSLTDLPVTLVK